jgi:polysaccharide export outer membrane protein
MKLLPLLCLISASVLIISCGTQNRTSYNYIENTRDTIEKDVIKDFEPVIQKNDLLSIQVYTSTTKSNETDPLYNLPVTQSTSGQSTGAINGYLVDANGNIEFPRLGFIHAEGLTKKQLADFIKSKITDLPNPTVNVRLLNFRITFLGEVGHPGTINIPYERVTILEAVGLAGDIPLTGKRNNVRIIREINGKREIGTVDLTSKDLFKSPYYNLVQNDVIIVDATKIKIRNYNESLVTQRVSLALTLITTATLLYNIFK